MSNSPGYPSAAQAAALAQELRALVGKLKRRLREQTRVGEMSPSQTAVLMRLDREGPATVSGLARGEGMRPQSMAPVVAALEALGLIGGVQDPTDGRQTILSLTQAARQLIQEGRAARQDWLFRRIGERLSEAEQAELARALGLVRRLVDD